MASNSVGISCRPLMESTLGNLPAAYFDRSKVRPPAISIRLPQETKLLLAANEDAMAAHRGMSEKIRSVFSDSGVQVVCPHNYVERDGYLGGEHWLKNAGETLKSQPSLIFNLPEFLFQFSDRPGVPDFLSTLYQRLLRRDLRTALFISTDSESTLKRVQELVSEPRDRFPGRHDYVLRDENGLSLEDEKVNNNIELMDKSLESDSHFSSNFYDKVRNGKLASLIVRKMSPHKTTKFSDCVPGADWYMDPRLASDEFQELVRQTAVYFGTSPDAEWDFESELKRADLENERAAKRDGKSYIPYGVANSRAGLVRAIEKCLDNQEQ